MLHSPELAKKITEQGKKHIVDIKKAIEKYENKEPLYLGFDSDNHDYELFYTIEDAREFLEEGFLDVDEGYSQYTTDYKIYKLVETVDVDILHKKSDYTDDEWVDLDFDLDHDEIWKHRFVPVDETTFNITDYPIELYQELNKLAKKYNVVITTAKQKSK